MARFTFNWPLGKMKAKIKSQYNQVSYLAQDTIWESGKNTGKHNTQESQEVSLFQAGDHKAVRSRSDMFLLYMSFALLVKLDI